MDHIEFSDTEVKEFHLKIMDNIRRIRKEKGITQLDLALTIGHKSIEYHRKNRS